MNHHDPKCQLLMFKAASGINDRPPRCDCGLNEIVALLEKVSNAISKHYAHVKDYKCDGCTWCYLQKARALLKPCEICGGEIESVKLSILASVEEEPVLIDSSVLLDWADRLDNAPYTDSTLDYAISEIYKICDRLEAAEKKNDNQKSQLITAIEENGKLQAKLEAAEARSIDCPNRPMSKTEEDMAKRLCEYQDETLELKQKIHELKDKQG